MEYQYPVCKLWDLLSEKYKTFQPFFKFSKEYSLDYLKVRKYGANAFKTLDFEFLYKICEILGCTMDDLIIDDEKAYYRWRNREKDTRNITNVGVVYFAKNKEGLTKIGKTQNLPKRMQTLKYTPEGEGVELLHYIESGDISVLEKTLHKVFSNKRVKGEWFNLTEEDIQLFKS